jgi:hypothetical protein
MKIKIKPNIKHLNPWENQKINKTYKGKPLTKSDYGVKLEFQFCRRNPEKNKRPEMKKT